MYPSKIDLYTVCFTLSCICVDLYIFFIYYLLQKKQKNFLGHLGGLILGQRNVLKFDPQKSLGFNVYAYTNKYSWKKTNKLTTLMLPLQHLLLWFFPWPFLVVLICFFYRVSFSYLYRSLILRSPPKMKRCLYEN